MVPQDNPQSQSQTIHAHLEHITRRWHELDQDCLLELVFLSAQDRAAVKQVNHYRTDADGIAMAVNDAETWNKIGVNVYATVNPINADNRPAAHKRASAEHIVASFFHWADADDQAAADNIRSFVGPKCTFYVLTGTKPTERPHTYWELQDPTRNLDAWSKTQKAIAATLKTDSSVIDPPRIMRVAGTVNWPKPQKQDKGYQPEVVSLHIYDEDQRPLVTSEQMRRAFGNAQAASDDPFPIDTGSGEQLATSETIQSALSGNNWNPNVNKLVWRYAALGLTDEEIMMMAPSLTLAGYSVSETQADMATMLRYAREQGCEPRDPEADGAKLTPEARDEIEAFPFQFWKRKDLTAIPYPEFIYSDFYARGYTSVTLAPPKVGKSMLGLAEALDIATGRGFLTGVEREPQRVVYYNAEDDQSVIDSRVAALLTHYGIDQSEIEGRLVAESGVHRDDFVLISGQEGVVNERLFVALEKFITDQQACALIFDPLQDLSHSPETNEVFRLLGQRLRRMASTTKVALGLIHHTRKIAPGVTPSIDDGRGGSALRGTARFNRLLLSMTEDEAAKAGIENHRHFLRIGDMESNIAPPSADVNRWFQKVSVETPNGQHVGAVNLWKWPDAFDGVSTRDAARVRSAIDQMPEPPRADVRSASWAGNTVADVLGLNITKPADKMKVKTILSKWIETDVLRVAEGRDPRAGRTVNVVVCGGNDPLSEVKS